MLNKGHNGSQCIHPLREKDAQDSISGCFYSKYVFIFGCSSLQPDLTDVPKVHSAVSGERPSSKHFCICLMRNPPLLDSCGGVSEVISLIKPLWKLLQHQTDELFKADLLAEGKWKSSLGNLTVYRTSFLLGWSLTLAQSGRLIWCQSQQGAHLCPGLLSKAIQTYPHWVTVSKALFL